MLRSKLDNPINAIVLIFLVITFLFSGIFGEYGYTDVYEFLYHADNENFIDVFIQGGRPLYGLLNKFALTNTETVGGLAWWRLFGVAGLFFATVVFFAILRRYLFDNIAAALCAVFFVVTPSGSIIGLWVATYQVGWGLAIAMAGGAFTVEAIMESRRPRRWLLFFLGSLCGLIAITSYQPTYTAFVIPALLVFLKDMSWKRAFYFLTVYFVLYIVYYGIHLLVLEWTQLPPLQRSGLTDDPVAKLKWFFRWPVTRVFQSNFVFYGNIWLKLVPLTFMAAAGFGAFVILRKADKVLGVVLVLGLVAFLFSSYIPNLISSDSWVSYRTLSTLFLFKLVLVFVGVEYLRHRFKLTYVVAVVVGLWLMANAWYVNTKGFTELQTEEYALVKAEVHRLIPKLRQGNELVFLMPELGFLETEGIVSRVVSDEFGSLSTSRDWVPMPMVKQILREAGETDLERKLKVINVPPHMSATTTLDSTAVIVDIESLYRRKWGGR